METSDLIKKVRKIEIKTRGLSKHIFSGEYHSAFKGRGMAFNEVREYQVGDDIRNIDWNVTARYNAPYIKIYEEERELTVFLLVDISGSQFFGTHNQYKSELITELCAVITFSAILNNDKIGILFFSDKIEKFIPPKKGKGHALRIIRELVEMQSKGKGTDIAGALKYFNNVIKKSAIVFLLSDFIDDKFDEPLRIASRKHDTIAIQVCDKFEENLPDLGLIQFKDSESGDVRWFDTSNKKLRQNYNNWLDTKQKNINSIFTRNRVDIIKISTDESYINPLKNFFKKRESRR
ncbi:MAG TPA: DUF58 domain-containing protein [Candidatus Kapabacteria bacterium]|nr:DUF58 domain-containing protein [Candidatus Kapabacteria bacterium]